ncbi:unnamed protein product [Mesocestoides corti]|uniref:Band 7 domain-containing protein n=1 Tax=Mesocestoides corti TaxID=53468 RepID=A0A0R3UKC9_MESCO|nr:unnamed protein product [Mesocestoides corti]
MVGETHSQHRRPWHRRIGNHGDDDDVDAEDGLIPLSTRRYTFSYEADTPTNRGDSAHARSVSLLEPKLTFTGYQGSQPIEFGTAFDFTPEVVSVDEKKSKRKMTRPAEDADVIPAPYQSIFTYESAFIDDPEIQDDFEERPETAVSASVYFVLVFFSTLLLLATFPVTAWFCIKKLPKSKTLIVYRLGRQLKPKGPGFALVLPFVDEYHVIDLEEQSLIVKPVSSDTVDGGEVEIGCRIVFQIVDVDAVISARVFSPSTLVAKKAETAVQRSANRIHSRDLTSGHALPDIASEVREPPNPSDKVRSIDFQKLGQQIASISPLLVGGGVGGPTAGTTASKSAIQFVDMINTLSIPSTATTANAPFASVNSPANVAANHSDPERLLDELIDGVLSRAKVFLANEKVRHALGQASLQVFVYNSDVSGVEPHTAAFYMDANTGDSEKGVSEGRAATATVHIKATDFSDILRGRLDVLEAIKNHQIRVSGSLVALSKLRYLLQFK